MRVALRLVAKKMRQFFERGYLTDGETGFPQDPFRLRAYHPRLGAHQRLFLHRICLFSIGFPFPRT